MRTVLAHGVFDLLHSGHISHLMQCRDFGDQLIVSVVADEYVSKPYLINNQDTRRYMLEALRCVNETVLCNAPGPEDLLAKIRPTVYARNDEYLDRTKPEYEICRRLGILLGFTHTEPPHTSDLISRIKKL